MNLQWLRGDPLSWKLRKRLYQRATAQMENGLSLERVLAKFQTGLNRRGKARAAAAIGAVEMRVRNGDTLVVAMGNSLTSLERTILDAGIRSGRVAQAMQLVLDVRELVERIVWRLLIGFLPSLVYLYALYSVLRFIGMDVVPEFEVSLPADRWTGWARVLYLMGHAASTPALPVLAWAIGGYMVWCSWAMPNWTGRGRTFFDRWVFPFPLYREITGFVWLLAFLALQRAKVSEDEALARQIRTASPWLASRLDAIRSEFLDGNPLAVSMQRTGHGFPSEDLIDDIAEYGDFKDSTTRLDKAAKTHSKQIERKVLFIGGGLAFALSGLVYAAMFIMQLASNSLSAALTAAMRQL